MRDTRARDRSKPRKGKEREPRGTGMAARRHGDAHDEEQLFDRPLNGGVGITSFRGRREDGSFRCSVESKSFAHHAGTAYAAGVHSNAPSTPPVPDFFMHTESPQEDYSHLYSLQSGFGSSPHGRFQSRVSQSQHGLRHLPAGGDAYVHMGTTNMHPMRVPNAIPLEHSHGFRQHHMPPSPMVDPRCARASHSYYSYPAFASTHMSPQAFASPHMERPVRVIRTAYGQHSRH